MKDLFRLLMVAMLSFAIVGAALLYSRDSDALSGITSVLTTGAGAVREAVQPTPLDVETPEEDVATHTRLWIARPSQDVWMGLAGFPDQYDLRFPMPPGISLVAGTFELEFESELAEHGDGRMTILVNGKRRGEIVLNTGREVHKVSIALDPEDLLGSQVSLELVGRGTTNSGQICPTDAANSGAAITLLPSSGLALLTDDAIDRPDIRLAALAEPIKLALGSDMTDQAEAIWAVQKMGRAGLGVRLAGADETADLFLGAPGGQAIYLDAESRLLIAGRAGVERVIAQRKPLRATPASVWPVSADALGIETLAKNFRGSRRWTLPYKIADLPGGLMPRQFELNLKTSTLTPGNDWVVRVSLNGNLLKSERFEGTSDLISLSVDLPLDAQGLSNSLLVELIDTTPNDSICRAGPDAQAQLLPTSRLLATGVQAESGWGEMVRALARAETVGLATNQTLSLAQAQRARALLATFLPINADMAFGEAADDADATLIVVPVGQIVASINVAARISAGLLDEGASLYFAVSGGSEGTGQPDLINLANAESVAKLAAHNPTDVGILIVR